MEIKCKSLFKGNASIGSHQYNQAHAAGEDITIVYKDKRMIIRPFEFGKFFTMSNKAYRHKDGRPGTYTLKYVKFTSNKEI